MPSLTFPSNPLVGDIYTLGTRSWRWNGTAWQLQSSVQSLDPFTVVRAIVTTSTNSISTDTGGLIVYGGVGIGRDVIVGGDITSNNNVYGLTAQFENFFQNSGLVAFGNTPGSFGVNSQSIAIGDQAGINQGENAIAVGPNAGRGTAYNGWPDAPQGISAVAIGSGAAWYKQGIYSVAIGISAARESQGSNAVAIGSSAAATTQSNYAVALGASAGKTNQGVGGIALGYTAAQNTQSNYAIAIGVTAGQKNQGTFAVALGNGAGLTNQGAYAVAIGNKAGYTNQPIGSIIINASSVTLDAANTGTYISPIRPDSSAAGTNFAVYYNPITKEITTSSFTGVVTSIIAGTDTAVSTSTGAVTIWNTSTLQSVTNRGNTTNNVIHITNQSTATGTGTGALIVGGGASINGDLWLSGVLYSGGAPLLTTSSFAKSFNTGTDISIVTDPGTGAVTISNTSTLQTVTGRGSTTTNRVTFANTVNATSTSTGAILVTGGIGVAKDIYSGGTITANTLAATSGLTIGNSLYNYFTSPVITSGATVNLDAFSVDAYRTAKYLVQVVDTGFVPNLIHSAELLVTHDHGGFGTQGYIVQYGIVTNMGELGTWDSAYQGGLLQLQFTPNYIPTSMTIKVNRTVMTT